MLLVGNPQPRPSPSTKPVPPNLSPALRARCLQIVLLGALQTYALDTGFLIEEFLRTQQVMPRGLAHPIIFEVSLELICFGTAISTMRWQH